MAAGRHEGYWELGLNAWDVCAGALIVREAGGLATTPDRAEFSPAEGPNDMVAANPHVHGRPRELVAEGLAPRE